MVEINRGKGHCNNSDRQLQWLKLASTFSTPSGTNTERAVKPRRLRSAGHVKRMVKTSI